MRVALRGTTRTRCGVQARRGAGPAAGDPFGTKAFAS
jgi:hypothetical protein